MKKTAILISNLGTPKSTDLKDIKTYLREFLMDPDVISIPYIFRWALVNGIILPFRSPKTQHAYKTVWTDRGSPLLFHSQDLKLKLQKYLGDSYTVFLGMRYSVPSLASQLEILKKEGFEKIIFIPLYPQYAEATSGTSIKLVNDWIKNNKFNVELKIIESFYKDSGFINVASSRLKEVMDSFQPDHVLMSFHGLPKKALSEGEGKGHCYVVENCCHKVCEKNKRCYKSHCIITAESMAKNLNLQKDFYSICFQSRLGRAEWIQPYAQDMVIELAKKGVKRLAVASPAFVADCLETIEEIQIGLKETFIEHGGEDLMLVPSLNSGDDWVEALANICLNKI